MHYITHGYKHVAAVLSEREAHWILTASLHTYKFNLMMTSEVLMADLDLDCRAMSHAAEEQTHCM